MAGSYPTAVTVYTNPGPTNKIGEEVGGRTLDEYVADHSDDLEQIMAKLGTGADIAAANELLRGTAVGVTAFGQLQTDDIPDGAITSAKILDGTLVNADVNASAALAVTKIAPGAANTVLTSNGSANSFGQVTPAMLASSVGTGLVGESLLMNGNFDHWQRGTIVTAPTTFNAMTSFAADRVFVLPSGAALIASQNTNTPNAKSRFSLSISGAASVTTVGIGQRISYTHQTRYRQSLVFSCYLYNLTGAAYTPKLFVGTPGGIDTFTTVTTRANPDLQPCPDSTWTRVYHVFDPSAYTNIANGLEIILQIPSGSSVAGDTTLVSQFDLRPGSQLVDYVPPDPAQELLRCQAYYLKTFNQATAVAQASGSTLGALSYRITNTGVVTAAVHWRFPVVMAKLPTMTGYSTSSANAKWRNSAISADSGDSAFLTIGQSGCEVANTQVAGDASVGNGMLLHATANAELT